MRLRAAFLGALLAGTLVAPSDANALPIPCPAKVDGAKFTSAADLRALNQVMADAGPRPTASPAQERYVDWLEAEFRRIPGMRIRSDAYTVDRWLETGASLSVGGRALRVAGAVPYSRATSAAGPLVFVPADKAISAADVAGKVVVRDRVISGGQQAIFFAVADYVHDPDASIDYTGNYERDVSAYAGIVADLEQAAKGKAAGLVFAASVPHDQAFSYAPYHGDFWGVPALQVGVDEGAALKAAVGQVAAINVAAERNPKAPTRNVIATLKGQTDERIVFASHTDGMNAVWDNGPTAMLALARYVASLPMRCRPRTFEFGLTSAHLHQDVLGSLRYAKQLNRDYAKGTVAAVITLEHLGALEYLPGPRAGKPGFELRYSGKSEPFVTFSSESAVTKHALISSIRRRDLRRTWALRGADAPAANFPPHRSYGGEGGIYHQMLLPTIAAITGPNTLFKPNYSLDDLLDVHLMRRQTMAFGDVALALAKVPRKAIAGADLLYRRGRALTGGGDVEHGRAKPAAFYCDVYAAAQSLATPPTALGRLLPGPGEVPGRR